MEKRNADFHHVEHLLAMSFTNSFFLFQLDQNVTETYLGIVTASYSCGQFLTSFAFGFWSDRRRSIEPLFFSVVLLAVGSLMYGFAEVFAEKGIYIVLAARILQGLSSGMSCDYRNSNIGLVWQLYNKQ